MNPMFDERQGGLLRRRRHRELLKTELVLQHEYQTREEAKGSIFEYVEVFYNRKRRHSSLGYLSPCEYDAQLN